MRWKISGAGWPGMDSGAGSRWTEPWGVGRSQPGGEPGRKDRIIMRSKQVLSLCGCNCLGMFGEDRGCHCVWIQWQEWQSDKRSQVVGQAPAHALPCWPGRSLCIFSGGSEKLRGLKQRNTSVTCLFLKCPDCSTCNAKREGDKDKRSLWRFRGHASGTQRWQLGPRMCRWVYRKLLDVEICILGENCKACCWNLQWENRRNQGWLAGIWLEHLMDCDSFYQQGQDWRRRRWGWGREGGERAVRGLLSARFRIKRSVQVDLWSCSSGKRWELGL